MERPTTAAYLSLIAGALVILGGIAIANNGIAITFYIGSNTYSPSADTAAILGVVGAVSGGLMIVGAYMMFSRPEEHALWSVLVLILSFFSLVTSLGGFIIGFLLGLVGGWKGLRWRPGAQDLESYVDDVINYLVNTPGDLHKVFDAHDKSGLDAVVGYLKVRDPELSAEEANAVAIRVIAARDKLVQKPAGFS